MNGRDSTEPRTPPPRTIGAGEADVIIVGAGPVGMTLGMDLADRGVHVVVVETRARREPPSVKCNHISARTMETFRRLGVADALRDTRGLPFDHPNDVAFRTAMVAEYELARIVIPCRRDRLTATGGPDTWWPTPEPPHRLNQIDMEPVLFDHLERRRRVTILNRTRVESIEEDDQGIDAVATDLETGDRKRLRARFLIGCDGARSLVRKHIGAAFEGTPRLYDVQSTFIRAPTLRGLLRHDPAWMTIANNPRRCGSVLAIDGQETWLVHNSLLPGETYASVDRDRAIRDILGVGSDFDYEVIAHEDWTARRLVADRFRKGRVFICGDAAQLWVPMAGYGMNAGIASAMDLSWMLAAHLHGWAGPAILDAYEAERRPISDQVSRFAMDHAFRVMADRKHVPAEIEQPGSPGEEVRAAAGKALYELNVQQFCCGGLNFGYYYDRSPIIVYDGEAPPDYSMYDFTPSTAPGCRLPHFTLSDGRSLYDALGADFTLIRMDRDVVADGVLKAASERGVPITLLDLDQSAAPAEYRHPLLLVRPDRHIAWRGHHLPGDPEKIVKLVSAGD
ncbi:FAD-dependent oxidoreductase [Sphingosinicella sp. CPCC 101087]|uniref:FAD-dependent oxidoreductase n=1 Tax=Sphingosinicella sp. CPCC 101087 TaxID=2497754 RepID=UPI0019803D09|nr:FAD-dependent oxidoreductase [Sphingosinicella sp. CPCC 101087]